MPSNNMMDEGWGIAYQQSSGYLFASDGSKYITKIDESTWSTVSQTSVKTQDGVSIENINELEIIQKSDEPSLSKYIFANEWQENIIYMIDIESGVAVTQWNLKDLLEHQKSNSNYWQETLNYRMNAVLNGIAYYEPNDTFLITGKLWDFIFEVDLNYRQYI